MTTTTTKPIDITAALAIEGWMPKKELAWLAQRAQRAMRILEIGAWQGRSTCALYTNAPEGARVTTVDTWAGDPRDPAHARRTRAHYKLYAEKGTDVVYEEFVRRHVEAITAGRLRPVKLSSEEALAWLWQEKETFDFIFIDGCHQYEAVADDIGMCLQVLAPGGLLSGHDYIHKGHPGVKKAVDEAFGIEAVDHFGAIWFLTR